MATIAKAISAIDISQLNGQDRPVAYVPQHIVEKNVTISIEADTYGNNIHKYKFTKDKTKFTSNLSIADSMSDGDSITVVLGVVETPFAWSINGKSDVIPVGKQKLLAKPVSFKL